MENKTPNESSFGTTHKRIKGRVPWIGCTKEPLFLGFYDFKIHLFQIIFKDR